MYKRLKLIIDAINKHLVVRFVLLGGGYPLIPPNRDLKSGATPFTIVKVIEDLGPDVAPLASFKLDEFKANFISEDEVRNVLASIEHALACQRKSSEIDR